MVRFLTDAAGQLVQHQMLRLQAMQLDGVPVAVSFGILHRNRHYYYLCDFNSQYSSFSPGTLLTSYAMEQAAKHGAQYFDFLQGEEEYKYKKWGAQPRLTWRIQYLRDLTAVSNDKAAQVL